MKRKIVLSTALPFDKTVGKVRDIYDLGDKMLLVTTDRMSAFDVIMNEGIPDKGFVLNQISAHWFREFTDIVPNHLISINVADFPAECQSFAAELDGRSMLVKKAVPLKAECIVRGCVSGSGWKDYQATGSICGIKLPAGLVESGCLKDPIFTPSTKAELGTHDENITFDQMVALCGADEAEQARDYALRMFKWGRDLADEKGIIIADTKFEFGILDGKVILIDECMTPDSSRFWAKSKYQPGGPQPSFDKQFLRDYLETLTWWNKTAPPPNLPLDIIKRTRIKYLEALWRIAGIQP